MQRKKSQLLFNFLPDDTFNHARNGTIGRVGWIYEDRQSKVSDLPISYILRRIRPHVERWPNEVPLRPGDVNIVSPDGATFSLFPRVFECRRCGACTEFSEDEIQSQDSPRCGHCSKSFDDTEQLQFVTVCNCGYLGSLSVPTCNSCGHHHPKFRRPTSRMRDAYWECAQCSSRIGDAYYSVDNCRYCGDNRRIKQHSSSTTFYPQVEKFVNIQDENLEYVTKNEAFQRETIVDYILDQDAATEPDSTEPDVDPEILDKLGISKEEYLDKKQEVEAEKEEEREQVDDWVDKSFDDSRQRIVSEEVFEYQSLVQDNDIDSTTLEDLQEDAETREDLDRVDIDAYLESRDKLNLESVRLITDFPITTVVYGYSRLNPGPNEDSYLNTFHGQKGRDRMFAQTADAEAVMFSLDKQHVIKWLLQNGIISEWPDEDLDRWFLQNLSRYPYYDEVDPEEDSEVARHTLSLLHTMSHTVMNGIDALSGYSKDSLVEYLLPHTLSFVIYKRSDTDFSLGAMHTLVENRFTRMADYIRTDADLCIYDPVCEEEENAACEDCLYISNISCDNGNHNLSRSALYGGGFDEVEIDGYLDISISEEDV